MFKTFDLRLARKGYVSRRHIGHLDGFCTLCRRGGVYEVQFNRHDIAFADIDAGPETLALAALGYNQLIHEAADTCPTDAEYIVSVKHCNARGRAYKVGRKNELEGAMSATIKFAVRTATKVRVNMQPRMLITCALTYNELHRTSESVLHA